MSRQIHFFKFLFYFFPKPFCLIGILYWESQLQSIIKSPDSYENGIIDIQSPYLEIRNLGATTEYVFTPEGSHAENCKEVRSKGR